MRLSLFYNFKFHVIYLSLSGALASLANMPWLHTMGFEAKSVS